MSTINELLGDATLVTKSGTIDAKVCLYIYI